jgi:hypothetical protein
MKATASTRVERRIEAETEISAPRDGAAVRDDEVVGYGSNCTWSRSMRDR